MYCSPNMDIPYITIALYNRQLARKKNVIIILNTTGQ